MSHAFFALLFSSFFFFLNLFPYEKHIAFNRTRRARRYILRFNKPPRAHNRRNTTRRPNEITWRTTVVISTKTPRAYRGTTRALTYVDTRTHNTHPARYVVITCAARVEWPLNFGACFKSHSPARSPEESGSWIRKDREGDCEKTRGERLQADRL